MIAVNSIFKSVKKEISLQIKEVTEAEVKFIELVEAESVLGPKLWVVPFEKFKEGVENKALIYNENDTMVYNYYNKINTNTKWKNQKTKNKSFSQSQESSSQTEFGY